MSTLVLPDPNDGPRVHPRQPHQVSADMVAAYEKARWRWGIHNNLMKTMAALPQLGFTEVDYANSFLFDQGTWIDWPNPSGSGTVKFPTAGFIDRISKELVINLVCLTNRSRYSITHHSLIGFETLAAGLGNDRAERMLHQLVDASGRAIFEEAEPFEGVPLYSDYQLACLRFAKVANEDAHAVSDELVADLRQEMRQKAVTDIVGQGIATQFSSGQPDAAYVEMWVDGMFLELSWNICHFGGLLNRWFTILKLHDESGRPDGIPEGWSDDFFPNFVQAYNETVPKTIRIRNNNLLGKMGFGHP